MPGPWDQLLHKIVDTHCHVHHYSDPIQVAESIQKQKLKVHCVTVRPSEFSECRNLFKNYPQIIPCLGLFPLNAGEDNILNEFLEQLHLSRYVGEIGLDYSISDEKALNTQKEVFNEIISACSKLGNKVLSIHSRRSADDVLNILGNKFNGTAIMHWFSGDESLVKSSPKNIYYSINTAMLRSRQGKKIIRALKPEQVLTETDGPYIELNGTAAVPSNITAVVNSLSSLWNKSLVETMDILTQNYERATCSF